MANKLFSIGFMRFYLSVFVLLCFLSTSQAAEIEYTNMNALVRERIDLKDRAFWREIRLNQWEKIGNIDFGQTDLRELPTPFAYHVFYKASHYWISIAGTGQLYDFDPQAMTFRRLDKTYFRGYNFGALKFVRKDTLFSFGGLGFWHYNNIETFFSLALKEWERVPIARFGPERILENFSGYSRTKDKLFVLELPDYFVQKPVDFQELKIFTFDFGKKSWETLGWVSYKNLQEAGMHSLEAIWVQNLFILPKSTPLMIIDPVNNKVYEYKGLKPNFFNPGYVITEKGSMIYSYQVETPINSHSTNLDSMSVKQLLADSREIGPFYSTRPSIPSAWYGYALGILLFALSVFTNLWFWRRAKKQSHQNHFLEGLTPDAELFMKRCLEKGPDYQFSSEEITSMMGLSQRSFDSQRQYRSKMINQINQHFKVQHGISEAIIRVTSTEDKRFLMYSLSPTDFARIKQVMHL